jgi:hypothetical protein
MLLLILCSQEVFNIANAYKYCLLSYGDFVLLTMFSGQYKEALALFYLSIRCRWHYSIIDFLIWYFLEVISRFHMILSFSARLVCEIVSSSRSWYVVYDTTCFDYVVFCTINAIIAVENV